MVFEGKLGLREHGQDKIGRSARHICAEELRGHHPSHNKGNPAQIDRLPQNRWVPGESSPPVAVADHSHRLLTWFVIIGSDGSSQHRTYTQDVEVASGNEIPIEILPLAVDDYIDVRLVEREHARE